MISNTSLPRRPPTAGGQLQTTSVRPGFASTATTLRPNIVSSATALARSATQSGIGSQVSAPNYLPINQRYRRKRIEEAATLGAMVAALAPEVAPQKPQNMPHLNSPIDDCGNTLLHLACCHLDHSLVCILLLKGAQPNVVNFSGTTPLRIVRLLANEELERLLIEHGAKEDDLMDPRQLKQQQQQQQQQNDEKPATPTGGGNNNISSPQTTMQRQAAGQGNRLPNRRPQLRIADDISVQLQRQYAQRKLSMNESQLLLEAAYIGYEDIFSTLGQRLQSTDEDIDCQDAYGCTPLMRAGYRGQVSIVRTLLENRADPRKVDELGYSALIWTCLGGSFECLEFLLAVLASLTETLPETLNAVQGGTRQHAPQLTALIAAAYSGSKQCVNTLIRLGAAVNQRTESGLNALTVATWMGWKDIVPLLLSCGAELPSPNHHWIFLGLSRALGLTGDIQMDLQSIVSYIPPMPSDAEPFVNAEGMLLQLKLPIDTAINVQGQTLEHKSQIIKLRELIKNVWGAQIISKEAIINQYDPELQRKQRRKIIAEFGIKDLRKRFPEVNPLAWMFSVKGTELDLMHMRVIRHVVNLAKSAEFGDKAQYLDIVHSMLQQLRDLIGIIRDCLSHKRPLTAKLKISTLTALLEKTSASGGSGAGNELLQTFSPLMDQTFLFMEIRRMTEELMADIEKMANITAIATGAWPPPEAVQNMIVKACELSCESKRMVMLANALGHWPIGSIDLEQKVFTDAVTEVPMPNDTTFVGGDEMSKSPKEKSATPQQIPETTSENTIDGDHAKNDAQKAVVDEALTAEDEGFFRSIEENIRRFVQTIQLLKEANFQKRKKELEPHAYTINYHADTIVEEIRSYELFKGDYDQNSNNEQQPSVERFRFDEDFKRLSEAVRLQSENLISKATLASGVWPPENASEQLKVAIATLAVVVKQMFTFAKQSTISMRQLLKTREQDEAAKRQAIDATLQERLKYNEYRKRNLGTFIGRGGWASGANSDQALAEQFRPTEKDILIAREKDGQVIIKGGKLARLVLQLVNPYENADIDFQTAFLLVHPTFTSADQLLYLLMKCYGMQPTREQRRKNEQYMLHFLFPMQARIIKLLENWVKWFPTDFSDNQEMCNRMLKVLNETIIKDVDETEKINLRPIITTLEQFKRKANFRYNSSPDPQNVPSRKDSQGPAMFPKSLLPRSDTEKLLEQSRGIFEFDPVELARQLCLLDFEIYSVIGRSELLNQNWEKPDRAKLSPNITEMIKNTNSLTHWVTNLVLESGDIKSRAQAIMFVVSIAMQCKEMQNFNTLTALIAGLTMGPVYRLQKTWSLFREKHQKYASAYDEISDIVSARGQYANYRRTLKQCEPPVIPFLGVYLTDLTFIELGNPNFLPESGFINLGKHSKTARIIREMHSYQRESFKFAPVPELKKFFRALNKRKWRDEKQLYQQSFAVEPKEIESDDDSSGDEA